MFFCLFKKHLHFDYGDNVFQRILSIFEVLNNIVSDTAARNLLFDTKIHLKEFIDAWIDAIEHIHCVFVDEGTARILALI